MSILVYPKSVKTLPIESMPSVGTYTECTVLRRGWGGGGGVVGGEGGEKRCLWGSNGGERGGGGLGCTLTGLYIKLHVTSSL